MNYVVKALKNLIVKQIPKEGGKALVRIDGFEDLRLYFQLCSEMNEYCKELDINFIAKLSKDKFDEFDKSGKEEYQTFIQTLKDDKDEKYEWVNKSDNLTEYRNIQTSNGKKTLIMLMGTESIQDRGGLSDFYNLNHDSLMDVTSSNYHMIFPQNNWSEIESECINKLYKSLFELVPENILKISNCADSWQDLDSLDAFINRFFNTLDIWGIPLRKHQIPSYGKIMHSNVNLLRTAYDFIERKEYKKITKKEFHKILRKIVVYDENGSTYSSSWEGWNTQGVSSYELYAELLGDFVLGKDSEINRRLLLNIDFAITEAVLDIKLEVPSKLSKKVIKIYGEPLSAMLNALFVSLDSLDVYLQKDAFGLVFDFKTVGLIDAIIPEDDGNENEQLNSRWESLCYYLGGIIDYIGARTWKIGLNDISVSSSSKDFFSPHDSYKQIHENRIKPLGTNQRLNKIKFSIYFTGEDGGKIIEKDNSHDFEWKFSNSDSWIVTLRDFADGFTGKIADQTASYIPFGILKEINETVRLKSNEEFFESLECSKLSFESDIFQLASINASTFECLEWEQEYFKLGRSFVDFYNSILKEGLFKDLFNNENSKLNILIDRYIELGEKAIKVALPENQSWVMTLFIHAFCIEASDASIRRGEQIDFCIIPPWHPATLQKIKDQLVFILDGAEQWWSEAIESGRMITTKGITDIISELEELSFIHESIDIFPTNGRAYFGNLHAFGPYCVCGSNNVNFGARIREMLKKEAVFDDDFDEKEFTRFDAGASMLYDIITDYLKAIPTASDSISLAFIDPPELPAVVAALHKYIDEQMKLNHSNENNHINVNVNILLKPENMGGKQYLSYWVNTYFSQDENVDIKIFLNEWSTPDDVSKLLKGTEDIVFIMDVLKVDYLDFEQIGDKSDISLSDCLYPMVYIPMPSSRSHTSRKIELTQVQFTAATVHSQAVYYSYNPSSNRDKKWAAVRGVVINDSRNELISIAHEKSNWVVCVDGGMDGALLNNQHHPENEYNIIGFSTGKGPHGQYNLTITAKKIIIFEVEKRLKNRLHQLFYWENEQINKAAKVCIDRAGKLDGISLFSALNPADQNIREFMAYIMTSIYLKQKNGDNILAELIHLDSYRHWFSRDINNKDGNKSRPDFLYLVAEKGAGGKIKIKATVIECKIFSLSNMQLHKAKAISQVHHGIKILSQLFNPNSKSVRRRYWFAQLYRALAFAKITFTDDTADFADFSKKMRNVIDGQFEIEWNGTIMAYCIDMDGDKWQIENETTDSQIETITIPQKVIQRLLLGENEGTEVEFVKDITTDFFEEEINESWNNEVEREPLQEVQDFKLKFDDLKSTNTGINKRELSEINKENITPDSNCLTQTSSNGFNLNDVGKIEQSPIKHIGNEITDIRVELGKDRAGKIVFWDFGHPKLSNRHVLITGRSGQGKTYAIQTMLADLSNQGIPSIIFDYTEGFRSDQLEEEFKDQIGSKINQRIVYSQGIPINPFRFQEIEVGGEYILESHIDIAQRISNIFTHVYKFGEQQSAAVYEACRIGLEKYKDDMDFIKLRYELAELKIPQANSVLSKLAPFLDRNLFDVKGSFDWNQIRDSDGEVWIFQLTNFVRDIQVIITEIMLWDAWHYNKKNGDKNKPFVVVLDEAQNLSHKANAPSATILTEGRKFGWSAWFATQFMKSQLNDDEINRLQQAALRMYFKPTDDEVRSIAKQLDSRANDTNIWIDHLKNLEKGECIIVSERERKDSGFGPMPPTKTRITSFKDRGVL